MPFTYVNLQASYVTISTWGIEFHRVKHQTSHNNIIKGWILRSSTGKRGLLFPKTLMENLLQSVN